MSRAVRIAGNECVNHQTNMCAANINNNQKAMMEGHAMTMKTESHDNLRTSKTPMMTHPQMRRNREVNLRHIPHVHKSQFITIARS